MSSVRLMRHGAIAVALAVAALVPYAARVQASPSLSLTNALGYVTAVQGHGWSYRRLVALTVLVPGWIVGVELQTGVRGYFKVGVGRVGPCPRPSFLAQDTAGRRATIPSGGPYCPTPTDPPRPELRVLKGHAVSTTLHRIVVAGTRAPITMRLGERLRVWEASDAAPSFTPHVDDSFLALLEQYTSPARSCAAVDCARGFLWTWVAIRIGTTTVDLSPVCLQSHPPCGIPDFAITVHVVP